MWQWKKRVKEAAYAFCFGAKIKHAIAMQKLFSQILYWGFWPAHVRFCNLDLLLQFKVISFSCNLRFTAATCQLAVPAACQLARK